MRKIDESYVTALRMGRLTPKGVACWYMAAKVWKRKVQTAIKGTVSFVLDNQRRCLLIRGGY